MYNRFVLKFGLSFNVSLFYIAVLLNVNRSPRCVLYVNNKTLSDVESVINLTTSQGRRTRRWSYYTIIKPKTKRLKFLTYVLDSVEGVTILGQPKETVPSRPKEGGTRRAESSVCKSLVSARGVSACFLDVPFHPSRQTWFPEDQRCPYLIERLTEQVK